MASEIAQFELSDPPTDGITRIKFANKSNHLIVSSWDKSVIMYEIQSENTRLIHSYEHNAGVLDCTIIQDDSTILSVGCDHCLQSCDVKTANNTIIGYHNMPIRCVEYNDENNIIITGSWDKTIKLWDLRSGNANNNNHDNNNNNQNNHRNNKNTIRYELFFNHRQIHHLLYIHSKLTILTFITIFSACVNYVLSKFTRPSLTASIDLTINCFCFLLSFTVNDKYYRSLCFVCRTHGCHCCCFLYSRCVRLLSFSSMLISSPGLSSRLQSSSPLSSPTSPSSDIFQQYFTNEKMKQPKSIVSNPDIASSSLQQVITNNK